MFAIYEGDWSLTMRRSLWLAIFQGNLFPVKPGSLDLSLFEILSALCSHHILNFAIITAGMLENVDVKYGGSAMDAPSPY